MASANPGSAAVPPPSTAVLRRAIGASAIGNATEWFDYGIYAYGITYISAALFPEPRPNRPRCSRWPPSRCRSWCGRSAGCSGGPIGDKIGRKRVLAMTIILMASATFLVGLLPTYASIGIAAPILLYLLRIVQGFSTGGEYGGAATFMAEYAPDARRGFFGSFLEVGTLAGFSLGALLMLGFLAVPGGCGHARRLPFLVAAPLGLVGMYLRSRIEDTPVFRELESQTIREPSQRAGGLRALAVALLAAAAGDGRPRHRAQRRELYPAQLHADLSGHGDPLGLSTQEALFVPIVGMLFMMLLLPLAGALSDRVGRKPLWWFSLVGLFVLVIPLYHLMGTGTGRGDRRLRFPSGNAVRAPAGDDLSHLPGDVPHPGQICRLRHRL